MGCWGEGVEEIWCRWDVRELPWGRKGYSRYFGGNFGYRLLRQGCKFRLFAVSVPVVLLLCFLLDFFRKMPVDPAFAADFQSCVDIGSRCVFPTFPIVLRPFKTLCFFNYALILRQDYDITSSLRRGALHSKPYEIPTENMATMEVQDTRSAESAGSGKSTSSPSMVGSPGEIYQPGWGVTNSCRLDTPDACQDVVDHIVPPGNVHTITDHNDIERFQKREALQSKKARANKSVSSNAQRSKTPTKRSYSATGVFLLVAPYANVEFLSQYNKNFAQHVAMGSKLRMRFEQEVRLLKKARAQIV
nr:hypothetical protein [Tanacetum cinerariifolium]